jgi:thioredoxin reductase (NADPH)
VSENLFDVIVVGGGPAGLSASIYASRMGLSTVVLERELLGGRAVQAHEVWNYPGFPQGIQGPKLAERMIRQAKKLGARLMELEEVVELKLLQEPKEILARGNQFRSTAVILATGSQRKKLLLPGETELLGRGVSYCPTCDGPLFRERIVAVVGSGNEAFEDALYLASLARKVFLITHTPEITAENALVQQVKREVNIEVIEAKLDAIHGDNVVTSIAFRPFSEREKRRTKLDGVFIAVGAVPMTSLFGKAGIVMDKGGCVMVDRRQATNLGGVLAAGDCTCGGMQIVTAVGEGAMAAMQAHQYITRTKLISKA